MNYQQEYGLLWAVGIAAIAWLVTLILKCRAKRRLLDPNYAFPNLDPTSTPHDYDADNDLPCCKHCGGGKLHQVHTGGPWPLPRKMKRGNFGHEGEKGSDF